MNRSVFQALCGAASLMLAMGVGACGAQTGETKGPGGETATTSSAQEEASTDMTVLRTRDWAAWINLMPGPDTTPTLYVTGEVELPMGGYEVRLEKRSPQGFNPQILMLDLITEAPDFGTTALTWYELRHEETAQKGQYDQVHIFHEGEELMLLDVEEAH